jgi:hypothetical protein
MHEPGRNNREMNIITLVFFILSGWLGYHIFNAWWGVPAFFAISIIFSFLTVLMITFLPFARDYLVVILTAYGLYLFIWHLNIISYDFLILHTVIREHTFLCSLIILSFGRLINDTELPD